MASIKSSKQQKLRSHLLQGYDWGEKKNKKFQVVYLDCPVMTSSLQPAKLINF